jgi:RNA polymerase sigma factor (sigma-70 family)
MDPNSDVRVLERFEHENVFGDGRDTPSTDPLSSDDELRLTTELQEAREAFAELVLRLPEPWRARVLCGDEEGPALGRRWPLRRLEACYGRLRHCLDDPNSRDIRSAVRHAGLLKRAIDRTRDTMVAANVRLVAFLARRLEGCGVPLLDLIQEGNLGLLVGIEKFEPDRGHRFATYAVWWIRRGLLKACRETPRLVRLPENVTRRLALLKKSVADLERELGRRPTPQEIAGESGLSTRQVNQLQRVDYEMRPLKGPAEPGDPDPANELPEFSIPTPLDSMMQRQLHKDVTEALSLLGPREAEIIRLRFGIDRERAHSLAEIGRMFDLSREGVRQVERRSLEKMQAGRESLSEHLN